LPENSKNARASHAFADMNTKAVVQFSHEEERKALPILLRHSPGMILRKRTYILSDAAVRGLRTAGITFTQIS
jgi:hypothetical protein